MRYRGSLLHIGPLVLFVAALSSIMTSPSFGEEPAYEFTAISYLGDEAPGGGNFVVFWGFQAYELNEAGVAVFNTDLTIGGGGFYAWNEGSIREILAFPGPAPGPRVPEFPWGRAPVNNAGDIAIPFLLSPYPTFPLGLNAALYYMPRDGKALQAVVLPDITPMPGGGHFAGVSFDVALNSRGDTAFTGLVPEGDLAPGPPGVDGLGIGHGIFLAERGGAIRKLVVPGDAAPGGGTFDFAINPSVNARGDVAFGAHLDGEECIILFDQELIINCGESIYLMDGRTGEIRSIVHQGDPAPGGETFRSFVGPLLNNRRDIAFAGDLTAPPGAWERLGVFYFSKGAIVPVAMPGDAMPGGGVLVSASFKTTNININNRGDVTFNATLDVDDNQDGLADNGLYIWSDGEVRLVARVGTEIPGVGVIRNLVADGFMEFGWLFSPMGLNNTGQVLFQAMLEDGGGVLLIATPLEES